MKDTLHAATRPPDVLSPDIRFSLDGMLAGFDEEKRALSGGWRIRTVAPRTVILRAGDSWNDFAWIERGLFRLYYTSEAGKECNKGFFAEGEFMGPIAPVAREEPSRFYVEALEGCRIHVRDAKPLHHALQGTPFGEAFLRALSERLLNEKVQREAEFLLDDAETRYRRFLLQHAAIEKRVSNRHIASYLGITEVTLSRIRRRLGMTSKMTTFLHL